MRRLYCASVFVVLAVSPCSRAAMKSESVAARLEQEVSGTMQNRAKAPRLQGRVIGHIRMTAGTTVKLKLRNGTKLRDRVGDVAQDDFELQVLNGDRVESRKIAFSEVRSIRLFDPQASRGTHNGLAGFAAGVGVLTVVILSIAGAL